MASSSSSSENPENNMSFQLSPENVMKLTLSVAALCDSEFNPEGLAMLDVTEKGFEITVCNGVFPFPVSDTIGYLFLDASQLINFHCNKPIAGKIISLYLFYGIILKEAAAEGTTMTVFHLDDFTTNLSFKFGKYPHQEVAIEFHDGYDEFDRFPSVIESCCKTVLGSTVLMEMIERLQETAGLQIVQQVSINISEKQVAFLVELPTDEPYHYVTNDDDDEEFEATVEIPGKNYNALFKLLHLESMKKAASVAPRLHLHFLTKPFGNIMIQFNIEEVGKLVFIQKASLEEP